VGYELIFGQKIHCRPEDLWQIRIWPAPPAGMPAGKPAATKPDIHLLPEE
jgi:hypothetical protein